MSIKTEWFFAGRTAKPGFEKVVAITTFVVLILIAIALSPILIILHFILRAIGRQGFYQNRIFLIDSRAFRRRLLY